MDGQMHYFSLMAIALAEDFLNVVLVICDIIRLYILIQQCVIYMLQFESECLYLKVKIETKTG